MTVGRFAIATGDDFVIGAADAERQYVDKDFTIVNGRIGDIVQFSGVWNAGKNSNRAHGLAPVNGRPARRLRSLKKVPVSLGA